MYSVADIGCGAGAQSILWAELGHKVHGLDVNAQWLDLARKRATGAGYDIEFVVGSVTSLPWPDCSMDVCVVVELLEHVADWQRCLDEFAGALVWGGSLHLNDEQTMSISERIQFAALQLVSR